METEEESSERERPAAAAYPLGKVVADIRDHLRDHGQKSHSECLDVMGRARRALPALIEAHLRPDQPPSRVSEMCLFLSVILGRHVYTECEQKGFAFSDADESETAAWLLRLVALMPLPRFSALQDRLCTAAQHLLGTWLPHHLTALSAFYHDAAALLRSVNVVYCVLTERNGGGAEAACCDSGDGTEQRRGGAVIKAFARLAESTECDALELAVPSARHATLCHSSLITLLANTDVAGAPFLWDAATLASVWDITCCQLVEPLAADSVGLHEATLQAAVTLLEKLPPPDGARQRLGVALLRLCGQVMDCYVGDVGRETRQQRHRIAPALVTPLLAALRALFATAQPQDLVVALPVLARMLPSVVLWWEALRSPPAAPDAESSADVDAVAADAAAIAATAAVAATSSDPNDQNASVLVDALLQVYATALEADPRALRELKAVALMMHVPWSSSQVVRCLRTAFRYLPAAAAALLAAPNLDAWGAPATPVAASVIAAVTDGDRWQRASQRGGGREAGGDDGGGSEGDDAARRGATTAAAADPEGALVPAAAATRVGDIGGDGKPIPSPASLNWRPERDRRLVGLARRSWQGGQGHSRAWRSDSWSADSALSSAALAAIDNAVDAAAAAARVVAAGNNSEEEDGAGHPGGGDVGPADAVSAAVVAWGPEALEQLTSVTGLLRALLFFAKPPERRKDSGSVPAAPAAAAGGGEDTEAGDAGAQAARAADAATMRLEGVEDSDPLPDALSRLLTAFAAAVKALAEPSNGTAAPKLRYWGWAVALDGCIAIIKWAGPPLVQARSTGAGPEWLQRFQTVVREAVDSAFALLLEPSSLLLSLATTGDGSKRLLAAQPLAEAATKRYASLLPGAQAPAEAAINEETLLSLPLPRKIVALAAWLAAAEGKPLGDGGGGGQSLSADLMEADLPLIGVSSTRGRGVLFALTHEDALVRQCGVLAAPVALAGYLSSCDYGTAAAEGRSAVRRAPGAAAAAAAAVATAFERWVESWRFRLLELMSDASEDVRLEVARVLLYAVRTCSCQPHVTAQDSRNGGTGGGEGAADAFGLLMVPLWRMEAFKDEQPAAVRAVLARCAVEAVRGASVACLRASGVGGRAVLQWMAEALGSGDAEGASGVIARAAAVFVERDLIVLRLLYAERRAQSRRGRRSGSSSSSSAGSSSSGGDDRELATADDAFRRFFGAYRGWLSGEAAYTPPTAGKAAAGDKVAAAKRDEGVSEVADGKEELPCLLRGLQAIGCVVDPETRLGRSALLWAVLALLDAWAGCANQLSSLAFDALLSISRHGRVPLPILLGVAAAGKASDARNGGSDGSSGGGSSDGGNNSDQGEAKPLADAAEELLPPLVIKLLETGITEEFVGQVLGAASARDFLVRSLPHVLPALVMARQEKPLRLLVSELDRLGGLPCPEVEPRHPGDGKLGGLLLPYAPTIIKSLMMQKDAGDAAFQPQFEFLLRFIPMVKGPAFFLCHWQEFLLCHFVWELAGPRRANALHAIAILARAADLRKITAENDASAAPVTNAGGDGDGVNPDGGDGGVQGSRKKRRLSARGRTQAAAAAAAAATAAAAGGDAGGGVKLSAIQRQEDAEWSRLAETDETADCRLDPKVGALLASKFLYLMSNVIVNGSERHSQWTLRSNKEKIRAMEVLGAVTDLLSPSTSGNFVPKVMATLNSALADHKANEALRRTAYTVMCRFVSGLEDTALASNLSGIVVSVLPVFMEAAGGRDEGISAVAGDGDTGRGAGNSCSSSVRREAVALLHTLIVRKRESLRSHFRTIPFMPDVPELAEVHRVLREEVGQLPLTEQLKQMAHLLGNESSQVRLAALRHLLKVLAARRAQLQPLVNGGAAADGAIASILAALLRACAAEENADVRGACASCLGELGAIDPARIRLRLGPGAPTDAAAGDAAGVAAPVAASRSAGASSGSTGSVSGAGGTGGGSSGNGLNGGESLPPWELTVESLALTLMRAHLVPAFRAAHNSMDQDRLALGLQELLRVLRESRPDGGSGGANDAVIVVEEGAARPLLPTAGGGGGESGESAMAPMPAWLTQRLREAQVLETVEPFWWTRYHMVNDAAAAAAAELGRKLPFFRDPQLRPTLQRWLSFWSRHLIIRSRSPLRPTFQACIGSVKTHCGMAQFLLPHLLLDVVLFGDDSDRDDAFAEINGVIAPHRSSISSSGSSSENAKNSSGGGTGDGGGGGTGREKRRRRSHDKEAESSSSGNSGNGGAVSIDHMATQAVFGVLDVLESWASVRRPPAAVAAAAGAASKLWPTGSRRRRAIRVFVGRVRREDLILAAMRVRAHTRALRYLEIHAREQVVAKVVAQRAAIDVSGAKSEAAAVTAGRVGDPNRLDGANGWLPQLTARQLSQLQAIWRVLADEPDGMAGVEAAWRAASVTESPRQRVWQHEHAEEWAEALQVYEQAMQGRMASVALAAADATSSGHQLAEAAPAVGAGAAVAAAALGRKDSDDAGVRASKRPREDNAAAAAGAAAATDGEEAVADAGDGGGSGSAEDAGAPWAEGELERGVLRALLELGHLDGALHQAAGMLQMGRATPAGAVAPPPHLAPALLPLAVEAAWQLERWPLLHDLLQQCDGGGAVTAEAPERHSATPQQQQRRPDVSLSLPLEAPPRLSDATDNDGRYEVALGRVVLCLQQGRVEPFNAALAMARAEVMAGLAAASMESYQRAYPLLLRVHVLRELEQGFSLRTDHRDDGSRRAALTGLGWDGRLEALAPSLRQVAPVLAARRAVLRLCGLPGLVADNWLSLAKRARTAGRWDVAGPALHQAGRLGVPQAQLAIQEAKLMHARGHVHRALLMLEPVEPDVRATRALAIAARDGNGGGPLADPAGRKELARRLLLTTNWMVEAGQKHGQAVIERYRLAMELQPNCERALFSLGQYMDLLFRSRVAELERQRQQQSKGDTHAGGAAGSGWEGDEPARRYVYDAMANYSRALRHGAKFLFQGMPRLLTLWFEIGELRDPVMAPVAAGSRLRGKARGKAAADNAAAAGAESDVRRLQKRCTQVVQRAAAATPSYLWYTCLPQLTSRAGHPSEEVMDVVISALARVLAAHPQQALWHLGGLALSNNQRRRQVGSRIFEEAQQALRQAKRDDDAGCVEDATRLFEELIALAVAMPASDRTKDATFSIGQNLGIRRFLVPLQAALTVSIPEAKGGGSGEGGNGGVLMAPADHNPFPERQLHIRRFHEKVRYMQSKAKPKRVSLQALETGETLFFLVKQERNGDLRKDARLMEFNGVVNRLWRRSAAGRRRKLRLRTYSVICLNEECGILEWVPDTEGLRNCISEGYSLSQIPRPNVPSWGQVRQIMDRIQMASPSLEEMVRRYRSEVLVHFPPAFHCWFLERFTEPTAWFEARATFARSAGAWSAVGHVVGLGDRHGENILLDSKTGECVHVDFDCLFDKGLTLARPELVPFRLTPNMVDGMGVTGYEGLFRGAMETSLQVLREHRETLLSVLEPFLRDPTVGWTRAGRAQRDDPAVAAGGGGGARQNLGHDADNDEAAAQLKVVDERLQGIYNLRLPPGRRHLVPARSEGGSGEGGGAAAEELPLSVQGQVHRLIQEATSHTNLCLMYIGWCPMQ